MPGLIGASVWVHIQSGRFTPLRASAIADVVLHRHHVRVQRGPVSMQEDHDHDGDTDQVTQLLAQWQNGESAAGDQVVALVYDRVRRLAASHLRRQSGPGAITLRPTELANELFLRLLDRRSDWHSRAHFYNAAAMAMRRILIDASRARQRDKRGGGQVHLTLSAADNQAIETDDGEALNEALEELRQRDPRKGQIIEMTYLLGLSREEIAEALAISVPTVDRDLRFARAWLQTRLGD